MTESKNITLRGFTIPELLVSMVISALVILGAFYALRMFSFQSKAVRKTHNEVFEYEQMILNLKTDFTNARSVERDFENLRFNFENRVKTYRFSDSIIIISTNDYLKPDTFFVHSKIEAAFFNGRYLDFGKVDKCELIFYPFGHTQTITFEKKYSAEDLMNFNRNLQ